MKKFFVCFLIFLFIVSLSACGNTNNPNNAEESKESIEVVCDISKYANISSSELIELLGNPNEISETTTATGFVDIPCVYYDYYSTEELGEVSFVLINDTVVKFISYNDFPLYNKEELLASFNIVKADSCAIEETETSLRFRCVTDKIDDLWVTNIEGQNYGFLAVTYDMLYFEEWYLPLTSTEQIEYQTDAEMRMKNILTFPKTADFPWYDWQFWKNQFYIIVSSYVDSENAFGNEIRTTFTFVYSRLTDEPIYVVINDEVVLDNGYIPTADLVKQLINEVSTEKAEEPTIQTNTEEQKKEPKPEPERVEQSVEKNDINLLKEIIKGVCSNYNSRESTPLNGYLVGYVNSPTEITIEHNIGDLIYSDTEYIVYEMENKLLDIFLEALNELFPEPITVNVYSNYDYVEYSQNDYDFEDDYESGSDLDGIVTDLTDEEIADLESGNN